MNEVPKTPGYRKPDCLPYCMSTRWDLGGATTYISTAHFPGCPHYNLERGP